VASMLCGGEPNTSLMTKTLPIILLLLCTFGCSKSTREEVGEAADSVAQDVGRAAETAFDTIGKKLSNIGDDNDSTSRQTVSVTLTDFKISMPSSLQAGLTRFNVVNRGTKRHNFELEGVEGEAKGKEDKLLLDLGSGDSTHLDVDLRPGKYTVYCPVGDHVQRGMKMTLTVQ
jgi:uncharacterized cupredoxin-like copper-binding protein